MYLHSYMEKILTMDSNVSKILVLNCGFHGKTERRLFCFFHFEAPLFLRISQNVHFTNNFKCDVKQCIN